MIQEYKKRILITFGISILCLIYGLWLIKYKNDFSSYLILSGIIFMIYSCSSYSKAKGYNPFLGLLCLVPLFIGVIALFILPDKYRDKEKLINTVSEKLDENNVKTKKPLKLLFIWILKIYASILILVNAFCIMINHLNISNLNVDFICSLFILVGASILIEKKWGTVKILLFSILSIVSALYILQQL